MLQELLKERVSDYTTFLEMITQMVTDIMGEEYDVQIYKITKNNSLELDSMVILKEGNSFSPNIYLLPYYEAYLQGIELMELAERICKTYRSCTETILDKDFNFSYEEVKPFIIYRLVSFERNRKLLEKIPHIRFLDLAITFHCLVREDGDGIGTIRITNEHVRQWKSNLEELHSLAISNTKRLFPFVIKSMEEVIQGMLEEEYRGEDESGFTEEMLDSILSDNPQQQKHRMYILTNQKGINGATCILYKNVLHEFADRIHSDLYILPSSIHEVILVPYEKEITTEALSEMVRDVNRTQVAFDEVLSDRVYYYSREKDSITM